MKKILARGGIEFLAVLLGLSGSLWIDNTIKENENKDQKDQSKEDETEANLDYDIDKYKIWFYLGESHVCYFN